MPSPLDFATFTPSLYPGMYPVLGIPAIEGPLEHIWSLAHEIGHLVKHTGAAGELRYSKNEAQADNWAACALIPEARIIMHANACEDSMIAAISAHYQDLPLIDCPERRLAAYIARIRLKRLEAA